MRARLPQDGPRPSACASAHRQPWGVYGGGGPALNLYFADRFHEADGGFNVVVGLEHRNGLFAEIKGGAFDSPNFKIGVGIRL